MKYLIALVIISIMLVGCQMPVDGDSEVVGSETVDSEAVGSDDVDSEAVSAVEPEPVEDTEVMNLEDEILDLESMEEDLLLEEFEELEKDLAILETE